jgi:hypothetical protein
MTGEGAPSRPAGFSLVFAGRGDPLVVSLSFQHSLARLTQPVERNEKPIAARFVFEREEEQREEEQWASLKLPLRIAPTSQQWRSYGLRSRVHANSFIETRRRDGSRRRVIVATRTMSEIGV